MPGEFTQIIDSYNQLLALQSDPNNGVNAGPELIIDKIAQMCNDTLKIFGLKKAHGTDVPENLQNPKPIILTFLDTSNSIQLSDFDNAPVMGSPGVTREIVYNVVLAVIVGHRSENIIKLVISALKWVLILDMLFAANTDLAGYISGMKINSMDMGTINYGGDPEEDEYFGLFVHIGVGTYQHWAAI